MVSRINSNIHNLLFLLILRLAYSQAQKETIKPLIFEFDKTDPQRVKINWDPTVDVKKIKDISSRDVHYVINNVTGKVREEYSPWLSLISEHDEVDPNRRLLFVKSDMCIEQDYRISWYDDHDVLHENAIQRMEPSPEPWRPAAKIEVTNLRYDGATKRILGNLAWAMNDEKLKGIPKLGSLHPAVRLDSCRTLFDKPIPLPVFDQATKIVSFDPLYARHECTFYARLRQMTYNGELECRSLRQTTDDQSDRIEMSCEQNSLRHTECRENDDQQPCSMTCDQQITASGEFDWSRGWPRPYVKVDWKPTNKRGGSKPVVSHVIRYAQVDSTINNYPIEEFNETFVETNASVTSIKLDQFSKDQDSLYTIQICTLYEACFANVKWSAVPKYPIYATSIIDQLPVPSTTSGTVPTTTRAIKGNGHTDNSNNDRIPRRFRSAVDNVIELKTEPPEQENTPRPASSEAIKLRSLWFLILCLMLFGLII